MSWGNVPTAWPRLPLDHRSPSTRAVSRPRDGSNSSAVTMHGPSEVANRSTRGRPRPDGATPCEDQSFISV